jgi:hypothetical protein
MMVSQAVSASLLEFYNTMIPFEEEMKVIAQELTLDKADWSGKYDDFADAPTF